MNDSESPDPSLTPAPEQPVQQPVADATTLPERVASLTKLFTATLVALLIMATGLNLYLLRQMMTMRKDLASYRPQAIQMFTNAKKEDPYILTFVGNLQAYSKTHPAFAPIFSKYVPALTQLGIIAGSPATAIPAAPVQTAPALK